MWISHITSNSTERQIYFFNFKYFSQKFCAIDSVLWSTSFSLHPTPVGCGVRAWQEGIEPAVPACTQPGSASHVNGVVAGAANTQLHDLWVEQWFLNSLTLLWESDDNYGFSLWGKTKQNQWQESNWLSTSRHGFKGPSPDGSHRSVSAQPQPNNVFHLGDVSRERWDCQRGSTPEEDPIPHQESSYTLSCVHHQWQIFPSLMRVFVAGMGEGTQYHRRTSRSSGFGIRSVGLVVPGSPHSSCDQCTHYLTSPGSTS